MSQSSEIQKIFKSRQVILELMEKQGYDTSKYTGSSITEVSSMHITQADGYACSKRPARKPT